MRRLRDAATELRTTKKSLIILSPVTKIPPELEKSIAAVVDWELPNPPGGRGDRPARCFAQAPPAHAAADRERPDVHRARGRGRARPHRWSRPRTCSPSRWCARTRSTSRPSSRRRSRSSARAACSSTTSTARSSRDVGGMDILKDWLVKRRQRVLVARARLRAAAAQGHPADRRARHRQVAHRQGGRRAVADAAPAPRRRQDLRRSGRLVRGEHPHGHQDRRGDRPGHPVDRRAREGLLGHRLVGTDRRRHHLARVRLVHHLAAGEDERRSSSSRRPTTCSALPPELLRKGRFDEIFFCDLPTREERRQIIDIHLRKKKRDPAQFDLDQLVERDRPTTRAPRSSRP